MMGKTLVGDDLANYAVCIFALLAVVLIDIKSRTKVFPNNNLLCLDNFLKWLTVIGFKY